MCACCAGRKGAIRGERKTYASSINRRACETGTHRKAEHCADTRGDCKYGNRVLTANTDADSRYDLAEPLTLSSQRDAKESRFSQRAAETIQSPL